MCEQEPAPDIKAKSASEIPVAGFRQVLIWPFVRTGGTSPEDWFKKVQGQLESTDWHPVESAIDLMAEENKIGAYEEAVYFHDFVRDFLYRPSEDMRIYRRASLERASFTIDG